MPEPKLSPVPSTRAYVGLSTEVCYGRSHSRLTQIRPKPLGGSGGPAEAIPNMQSGRDKEHPINPPKLRESIKELDECGNS